MTLVDMTGVLGDCQTKELPLQAPKKGVKAQLLAQKEQRAKYFYLREITNFKMAH